MSEMLRFKKARGNLCMPIILLSAAHGGVRNVMTAAWSAPSSFEPPLITVFVGKTRFTHDLIMKSGEFAINILADDQMDLAVFCGNTTGREADKFKEKDIAVKPGAMVGAPIIEGCAATIECRVSGYFLVGDHTAFTGETVGYEEDCRKNPLVRFRGGFYSLGVLLGCDEHHPKV